MSEWLLNTHLFDGLRDIGQKQQRGTTLDQKKNTHGAFWQVLGLQGTAIKLGLAKTHRTGERSRLDVTNAVPKMTYFRPESQKLSVP